MNRLNKWVGDNPFFAVAIVAIVAVAVASQTPIMGWVARTTALVTGPANRLVAGVLPGMAGGPASSGGGQLLA